MSKLDVKLPIDVSKILFKLCKAGRDHSCKLPLLRFNDLSNPIGVFYQLRICGLHFVANRVNHVAHERLLLSEQPTVPYSAAKNLAQHISAPFVRWKYPVRNQKRSASSMVGDDAQRSVANLVRSVGKFCGAPDKRCE